MKTCVLLVLAVCVACSKKPAPPHRTAPWLATPSASGAPLAATHDYIFTGESRVRFSVPGRKGSVNGHILVRGGRLQLDPRDLSRASASIDVDLTKLGIDSLVPANLQLSESRPEAVALQWLELGERVPTERRAQFANVRFELSSLEQLSTDRFEESAGKGKERTSVGGTAVGTVLLHGFRAPIRAPFVLARLPTPAGAPARLAIRSAGAFVLPLGPHDVTARGPSGVVDAVAASRAADWVGKNARVEFELIAERVPPAGN